MCMDYKDYDDDYGFLLLNFQKIAQLLTDKMDVMRRMSFQSSSTYLFGFSYGARLIAKAANDFGPNETGTIHCKCFSFFICLHFSRTFTIFTRLQNVNRNCCVCFLRKHTNIFIFVLHMQYILNKFSALFSLIFINDEMSVYSFSWLNSKILFILLKCIRFYLCIFY